DTEWTLGRLRRHIWSISIPTPRRTYQYTSISLFGLSLSRRLEDKKHAHEKNLGQPLERGLIERSKPVLDCKLTIKEKLDHHDKSTVNNTKDGANRPSPWRSRFGLSRNYCVIRMVTINFNKLTHSEKREISTTRRLYGPTKLAIRNRTMSCTAILEDMKIAVTKLLCDNLQERQAASDSSYERTAINSSTVGPKLM
ncbi:hypothetical protein L9F63_016462, partial [Diploptera punctata]